MANRINIIAEPFPPPFPFPLHDDIRAVWKGFGRYSRGKGLIPAQLAASSVQMLRTKAHSLVCQLEGRGDCLREGRPPHLGWRTGFCPSLKVFSVPPPHSYKHNYFSLREKKRTCRGFFFWFVSILLSFEKSVPSCKLNFYTAMTKKIKNKNPTDATAQRISFLHSYVCSYICILLLPRKYGNILMRLCQCIHMPFCLSVLQKLKLKERSPINGYGIHHIQNKSCKILYWDNFLLA